MVIEDLSSPQPNQDSPGLAPVADRVLSVLVDLTLFWPLFSLLMSGLLRQLQYRYYAAPDSAEFWILATLTAVGYSFLMILTQGICWSVWGATPGQFFFQLRVVRNGEKRFLSLSSAWLRSLLFWGECLMLGLPFLEVFSHAQRRTFHDRATEAEVITLKKIGAPSPNHLEIRVMRGFFTVCFATFLVWALVMTGHYYRKVSAGAYKEAELREEDYLCDTLPAHEDGGRMDAAIAMYRTGSLSSDCLMNEIDFAFWKGESQDQAWASLGLAVMNEHDPSTNEAYLAQTCEKNAMSLACGLAQWLSGDEEIPTTGAGSWARAVLAIESAEQHHDLESWQKTLASLPADFELSEFVETERIKLMWSENKSEQARGGYDVLFDHLSESSQRDLAAQFCFSEVTSECAVKPFRFCEDLESTLTDLRDDEVRPEWLVALAEQRSCSKTAETGLLSKAGAVDPESDWGQLLLAIVPDSGWDDSKRTAELRRLAFASGDSLLKSRALVELLRLSKDPADLEKGQTALARHDLPFQGEMQSLFGQVAQKMGIEKNTRIPASVDEDGK